MINVEWEKAERKALTKAEHDFLDALDPIIQAASKMKDMQVTVSFEASQTSGRTDWFWHGDKWHPTISSY